jgi:1-aminocyclopropane-1-carboxylate deaminase/D-cysteine desulfhydrase-like pyridoxal-dependent ACC family enzyme
VSFLDRATESFGAFPTRITDAHVDGKRLYVKREDESSPVYGGNKVRKLEHVFADARSDRARVVLTVGAAGSHHVLATAVHGLARGFQVEAVLVPQPWTAHAERNLRVALAHGLVVHPARTYPMAAMLLATLRLRRRVFYVPLGGSSVAGCLGYVRAAHELVQQFRQRREPMPRVHVVAAGSAGTAAGLQVGFELAREPVEIHAVGIGAPLWATQVALARLRWRLRRTLHPANATDARSSLLFIGHYLGAGYGHATAAGNAATLAAETDGLTLDATYTAKAYAYARVLAAGQPDRSIAYWHTLAAPTGSAFAVSSPPLPDELCRLFTR